MADSPHLLPPRRTRSPLATSTHLDKADQLGPNANDDDALEGGDDGHVAHDHQYQYHTGGNTVRNRGELKFGSTSPTDRTSQVRSNRVQSPSLRPQIHFGGSPRDHNLDSSDGEDNDESTDLYFGDEDDELDWPTGADHDSEGVIQDGASDISNDNTPRGRYVFEPDSGVTPTGMTTLILATGSSSHHHHTSVEEVQNGANVALEFRPHVPLGHACRTGVETNKTTEEGSSGLVLPTGPKKKSRQRKPKRWNTSVNGSNQADTDEEFAINDIPSQGDVSLMRSQKKNKRAAQGLHEEEAMVNSFSLPSHSASHNTETNGQGGTGACRKSKCPCPYRLRERLNATAVPRKGWSEKRPCGSCRCCKSAMEAHILANLPLADFPPLPAFDNPELLERALTLPGSSSGTDFKAFAKNGDDPIKWCVSDIIKEFADLPDKQRMTLQKIFKSVVFGLALDKSEEDARAYLTFALTPLIQWLKNEVVIGRIAGSDL
ncbi:hypothetical protein Q8F55_004563 [Vanrija albida]|uniref:Uncharacterized protein n=1 Tax=Vanrija albida TaxID=181172 RepID=A0ABR3Q739_9TREE